MFKTVYVAEDHKMFAEAIIGIINNFDDYQVIGNSGNGNTALNEILSKQPDIILLDIDLPEIDGIEICKHLKSTNLHAKIIIVTAHLAYSFISELEKAKADAYILKETGISELKLAMDSVLKGEIFFSEKVRKFYEKAKRNKKAYSLTDREIEIIRMIFNEASTNEIAEKLNISIHTVGTHRKNIMAKLGVHNVAGLIKKAVEEKILKEHNSNRDYKI